MPCVSGADCARQPASALAGRQCAHSQRCYGADRRYPRLQCSSDGRETGAWLSRAKMSAPSFNHEAEQAAAVEVLRCQMGTAFQRKADTLAREEPLEIRVRGRSIAVTMRTPGEDRELAAGFLWTEGILHKRGELLEIAPCLESECPENTVNVFLAPSVQVNFERLTRHVFAASSC